MKTGKKKTNSLEANTTDSPSTANTGTRIRACLSWERQVPIPVPSSPSAPMRLGHGGDKCWCHFTHPCISNQAEAGAAGRLGKAELPFKPLLLLVALSACYPANVLFFTGFKPLSRWQLHRGPRKTPFYTKTCPRQPLLLLPATRPSGPQGCKMHCWVRETPNLLDTFGLTKTSHPCCIFSSYFNCNVFICMSFSLKCKHPMYCTRCNENKIFSGVPAGSVHAFSLPCLLLALDCSSGESTLLSL